MNLKEIKRHMIVLQLMLGDLNDAHNNYDVDTITENTFKDDLDDAINNFNKSQHVWHASLTNTRKGWIIRYE